MQAVIEVIVSVISALALAAVAQVAGADPSQQQRPEKVVARTQAETTRARPHNIDDCPQAETPKPNLA